VKGVEYEVSLLIYAAERDFAEKSEEEQGRIYSEYMAYSIELKKSGKMLSCDPLNPTSTATTIRVRNSKTHHTDGPFADTKEQLGGCGITVAGTFARRKDSVPSVV